jgi:hypothetical protein
MVLSGRGVTVILSARRGQEVTDVAGPPPHGASLLDLLEPGWRRHLSAGELAGSLEVDAAIRETVAGALGDQSRGRSAMEVARRWPACLVVGLAHVAGATYRNGRFWPGWHRAAGLQATRRSADHWGQAFLAALTALGVRPPGPAQEAVLVHAALDAAQIVAAEVAGAGLTAGATPAAVLRLEPFGRGVLAADGPDRTWRPAVPDEIADPLLVFDEGGEPAGPVLPAEPVWVVHPAGLDLCSDVPPRAMVTSRLPPAWRGWRMALLDLRGVAWLELDQAARRRRMVRGRLKPCLVTGPPVPGVTTAAAAPVHAGLPAVLLPAGTGRWRIEARRAGGGPLLAAITTAAAGWRPDQLWRQVRRPVLGTVTVTATPADRSAGAGLRRSVTVAEGLGVAYSPVPRLTGEQGLEPAEAVLTTPPGMTVSPQAAIIPAESVAAGLTCVAGPVVVPLRVRPPHLRVRIEPEPGGGGKPTAWHHAGPLAISGSDLRRGGALRLDLPGLGWNPPLEVVAREQVVQVLQPTRQGRYPLRRMLDTVGSHREVSLRITACGRTAIIAHVRGTADRADPWLPAGAAPLAP